MDEATRNQLLRRVDWRFLLGRTRFARAACAAGPELRQAVGEIADAVEELGGSAECDLVVLSNPDDASLGSAWEALGPGGSCYAEWTRAPIGGAARARRRLERAGFDCVDCYWAWPSPARDAPQFWLPLDASQALRYFLESRPRQGTQPARLRSAALRMLWSIAYRLRLLAPVCATAHKPGPSGEAEAEPPLSTLLRERWSGWGLGRAPRQTACLMLTGGLRSINKVVVLAFADAEERPSVALKLARVPESEPALVRETTALEAVHEGRSTSITGVPRLVFSNPGGRLPAIGETIVEGQPLSNSLDAGSYGPVAYGITDFLSDLAGAPSPSPRDQWWDRIVEPVVSRFEACFGEVVEPSHLRAARAALAALPDLPLVCEQRDFSPWNVLLSSSGKLAVVDWESAEPRGLPGLDLVYFLTHAAFFLEGTMRSGRERATYVTMLDSKSFTGSVYAECVSRYAQRTGIDETALVPLRMLAWMLHARSDHEHLVMESDGQPGEAALRGSLFLELWLEDVTRLAEPTLHGSGTEVRPSAQA
jgi:hypothetical protein